MDEHQLKLLLLVAACLWYAHAQGNRLLDYMRRRLSVVRRFVRRTLNV